MGVQAETWAHILLLSPFYETLTMHKRQAQALPCL